MDHSAYRRGCRCETGKSENNEVTRRRHERLTRATPCVFKRAHKLVLVCAVSVKATAVTRPAASLHALSSLLRLPLTQFWRMENVFFSLFCPGKLSFQKKPSGQLARVKLNGFSRTVLFPSVMESTGLDRDVFLAAIFKSFPAPALWNPDPLYPFHVFLMSQGPNL